MPETPTHQNCFCVICAICGLFFTPPANLGVPVPQPVAALLAQQIPVEGHLVDTFIHPRRQLAAINICTYRTAIILLRGQHEALGRGYKFVETLRLFFIWRAPHDSDAVGYHRRSAGW